jgi:hypothetical protein
MEILVVLLVFEQELQHLGALGLGHAVDAHGVARIAVENGAPGDGMGAKDRLRYRRLLGALLRRQRRAVRAGTAAHHVPELGEVVRGRAPGQPALDVVRQIVVSGMHVAELRVAQRAAVAHRHLDGVQHVGERHLLAVGHVRVPTLSGIAEPDRLAVPGYVGQHHHLRKIRLVELIGDVDFEVAEHAAEAGEGVRFQALLGKAQHAERAEGAQNLLEIAV